MTVIITHDRSPSRLLLHSPRWLDRVVYLGHSLRASWDRRQTLRALEALPAETLKDIGWPATDNKATHIVSR